MHRTGESGRGVDLLTGQIVAPGTPVSAAARFQWLLTMCAKLELHSSSRRSGHLLACVLVRELSLDKRQLRAFRQLYLTVRKRAATGADPCAIWNAPRIQRLMASFIKTLKPRDPSLCFDQALRAIDDRAGYDDREMRRAISAFSSSSVNRYSDVFL